jgi:putative membrane protein insertion efficiency factor
MKYICVILIKFYRKLISPLKPPCCRFYPTCSDYAVQAFIKHGFFTGLVLSVYRIMRCNPFCKPGYDPVPDKIILRRKNNLERDI